MFGLAWRGWPYPIPSAAYPGPTPTWFKFPISHVDLQAAALTNSITIYTMPAAGLIHGVKLKHSVLFTGPAVTNYFLSVGFTGGTANLLIEYDVMNTAIGDQNFAISHTFDSRDHAAPVNVLLTGRSGGANLNQSTGGTAELWLCVSTLV